MPGNERYEFPQHRRVYPHWGQDDSRGSGDAEHSPLVPSPGSQAGETSPSLGAGKQKPPLKAKATAVRVPGQAQVQLEIMSQALGEVKSFLDDLKTTGIENILAAPKAQLQDVKLKRSLIAMINLVTGGGEENGLAQRAGGLTEDEETTVLKAMMLLN